MKPESAYMDLKSEFGHLRHLPEPMTEAERDQLTEDRSFHMTPVVWLAVFVCSVGAHALVWVIALKLQGVL